MKEIVKEKSLCSIPLLRDIDNSKDKHKTDEVNKVLCYALQVKYLGNVKTTIQAARVIVCERVVVKPKQQKQKDHFLKKTHKEWHNENKERPQSAQWLVQGTIERPSQKSSWRRNTAKSYKLFTEELKQRACENSKTEKLKQLSQAV